MKASHFEKLKEGLPSRYPLHYENYDNPNFWFATAKDSQGNPQAIIREVYRLDFNKDKTAFAELEAHGIKIAKHLPFVGPDKEDFLMVEFVEGRRLDEAAETDISKVAVREHAQKLAVYATDCALGNKVFLSDVTSPFQYIVRDGVPVLVDIDTSAYKAFSNPKSSAHMLGEVLCGIGDAYMGLVDPNELESFYKDLDDQFHRFVQEDSLLTQTADRLNLDLDRFPV